MNKEAQKKLLEEISINLKKYEKVFMLCKEFIQTLKNDKRFYIDILKSQDPPDADSNWEQNVEDYTQKKYSFDSAMDYIANYKKSFENKDEVSAFSSQYIELFASELASSDANRLDSILSSFNFIKDNISEELTDSNNKRDFAKSIRRIINDGAGTCGNILQRFAHLNTFEHMKDISHSVVIIGANGSGKSSFSRNTRKVLGRNVAIISAQKIFSYRQVKQIPINNSPISDVHKFQAEDKLGRDGNVDNVAVQDLKKLLLALIAQDNQCATDYYKEGKFNTNPKRKQSNLECVITIWNEIITHRTLKNEAGNIVVYFDSGADPYEFPNLSDGEKAIFYYIGHVLSAKENSFIIIDEPENHLHLGVVSRLWDRLEQERNDCKFIYLTHNLEFACSRIKAKKLWNKEFIPPAHWDVELLPESDDFPEKLLMELLGIPRKILFCEGDKSSLDYKLFSILFPEYSILPVGGHPNVINFTRAYNRASHIFKQRAIGIIDGDYHLEKEVRVWQKDHIFCIDVQEVENLLCDELLLKAAAKRFLADTEDLKKAKAKLISHISNNIENDVIEYSTQKLNNTLKGGMIEKKIDVGVLKKDVKELFQKIDLDKWISERRALLKEIVHTNDYDRGIMHYNWKGLLAVIPQSIEKDYKEKIFSLLENDGKLRDEFIKKHFSHIPKNGAKEH